MWSVSPAAMAGVRGFQWRLESPWISTRSLLTGRAKLYTRSSQAADARYISNSFEKPGVFPGQLRFQIAYLSLQPRRLPLSRARISRMTQIFYPCLLSVSSVSYLHRRHFSKSRKHYTLTYQHLPPSVSVYSAILYLTSQQHSKGGLPHTRNC